MGPSCRMCSSSTSGLSRPRSRWMKVRVSCTSTDGTSVKRSVSPCQIWSPAERYVELRYSAAVVSAVNSDTDTKMELGRRILTHSAIWGTRLGSGSARPYRAPCRVVRGSPAGGVDPVRLPPLNCRVEACRMFSQAAVVPQRVCRGRPFQVRVLTSRWRQKPAACCPWC
ncbi:hypothetical protein NQZ68_004376 [Dissostichus eleginoides]|nr:hypothetical protein NQZ68_004376 [Dissostichus eleginoides]